MEEETISFKQLFEVFIKNWKAFFIIILTTIILLTTFLLVKNKISNKNISIIISTTNNTNLIDYINTSKHSLIKETVLDFYGDNQINEEIEKENIKLNSSFSISSTNAKELNNAEAFKITIKPTNNYSDEDLENIMLIFLNNLNNSFVDPNNYLDSISTYKVDYNYSFDNNKEILENLLDLSSNITRLNNMLNKFEIDFSSKSLDENNNLKKCLAYENLSEIRNQLDKIQGSISKSGSLEYNIWQVVENNVSNNDKSTYLSNLSQLFKEDTKGIEKQIKNTPDASMYPNEYKSYVTTLNNRFGCEIEIYKNNKNIYEQAIDNLVDSEKTNMLNDEFEKSILKNISNYNNQVEKFNYVIENYVNADNILEISSIVRENTISFKKIVIYDFFVAFFLATIIYIISFFKLKKQGFFDNVKEK